MPKIASVARQPDEAASDNPVAQLCAQLERVGARPVLAGRQGAGSAAGALLSVDAESVLASELSVGQFRQQAYDVLALGLPLSLKVAGLQQGPAAAAQFSQVCEALRAAVIDATVPADRVEIVIPADVMSPEAACLVRKEMLGAGLTHILAGGALMKARGRSQACERYDQFWLQLWRLRDAGVVRAAYASTATSHSSLLAMEFADTVLPSIGIQVPEQSAWIPIEINLCRFADAGGLLDEFALELALRDCVRLGDALHDQVTWPTAAMRHDAWLNRRLAVLVTGFAELVRLRGADPRRFSCLQELIHLVRWVRSKLRATSRSIAEHAGHLPALDLCDPTRGLLPGHCHDNWRRRWQHALDIGTTRNRNLLVLSPWSMIPAIPAADSRHFDLLPLLEYADACAFAGPPPMRGWNINKFKLLHQRAWAVLERKESRERFAEQV